MSRIGSKTSERWPSTATYAEPRSWCDGSMRETYSPPTASGVTSRHEAPPSAVTCTRPSSVPAQSRPAASGLSASDTTVPAVSEIRLYFTGAPLMRGASVRVVTSGRQLMRSTPPAADTEDPKQVYVHMDPPLPPGTYVVQWRCIADDGHVMRGDFTFEVATQ